jgi:hypothetical protein
MVSSSECFRLKSAHNRNEPAIAHERIGHVQENTLGIALVVAAHVDVAALLGGDKYVMSAFEMLVFALSRNMIQASSRMSAPKRGTRVAEPSEMEVGTRVLDVLREIVGEEHREVARIGETLPPALRGQPFGNAERVFERLIA